VQIPDLFAVTALLGKLDAPTDALRDHCACLARALQVRGMHMELAEARWELHGWRRTLRELRSRSRGWRGQWVILHYTALSWSRRGFPLGVLAMLWTLRHRGVRCGIVFHDSIPFSGQRLRDRVRRVSQLAVMRAAYRLAARAIVTVPIEQIPWLPAHPSKAVFIPIGSHIPESVCARADNRGAGQGATVVVFGITGGGQTSREVADIVHAITRAREQVGRVRLLALGRGAEDARAALESGLAGSGVELSIAGVLPEEEIAAQLAAADVLLFVRGPVSPQRSSAIAGIACGLPIVGYASDATCFPIDQAGLELAPLGDREALGAALCRVLGDMELWQRLHLRSVEAQKTYFSWDAIARRYISVFGHA
jgi:glycosyltransferase involved in cell wall biosynthesis